MTAAAYGYAIGKAPPPDEWILLGYLDRFGAEATFSRAPTPREMRAMVLVENVISAYRESKATSNLADWVRNNRDKYRMLNEASELWQMLKSQS